MERSLLVQEGNKAFKRIIAGSLEAYSKATSKLDKSLMVSAIIDQIRSASPRGGFVRFERGQWVEVGKTMWQGRIARVKLIFSPLDTVS